MKNRSSIPAWLQELLPLLEVLNHRCSPRSIKQSAYVLMQHPRCLIKLSQATAALFGMGRHDRPPGNLLDRNRYTALLRAPRFLHTLPCSADLVLCISNTHLFYFREKMHVKFPSPDNIRVPDALKNELDVRKKAESTGLIRIPRLLDHEVSGNTPFITDEIIMGRTLSRHDPLVVPIFLDAVRMMFDFYRAEGITWSTTQQTGIDLDAMIVSYQKLFATRPECDLGLDLDRIRQCQGKLLPRSLIHGDFTFLNVISHPTGPYIIDWELAHQDWIIWDMVRALRMPVPGLLDLVQDLMVKNATGLDASSILPVDQQSDLALFFDIWDACHDPKGLSRLQRHRRQLAARK